MYSSSLPHGECDKGKNFHLASTILLDYSGVLVHFLLDCIVWEFFMVVGEFNVFEEDDLIGFIGGGGVCVWGF